MFEHYVGIKRMEEKECQSLIELNSGGFLVLVWHLVVIQGIVLF